MILSPAQLVVIKANILASGDMNTQPNTADGNISIANLYNLQASPVFTVWKTSVAIGVVGDNIVGSDLAGLSTLNTTRLQAIVMLSPLGVNPSLVDRRAFFDDVFSGAGGVATRAKLLILWKRLATRIEKLLATGTGTDALPATMAFEGTITANQIETARNLP